MTVNRRCANLYYAILAYASYYPRPKQCEHQLHWEVEQVTACRTPVPPHLRHLSGPLDTTSDVYTDLEFSFGNRRALLLWPPPLALEPERIVEDRKKVGIQRLELEVSKSCATVLDELNHSVFHVTRYELPVVDLHHEGYTKKYLHIATSAGELALKKFAFEVVQWYKEIQPKKSTLSNAFSLYRFRVNKNGGRWSHQGQRNNRDPESVVLSKGCMEDILQDVEHFLRPSTREWFSKHGLPYKRNYLFFGSPGTGKTSTIRVIAGQFELDCAFLSTTDFSFSNQHLFDALSDVPRDSVLVLEDVDAIFNKMRENKLGNSLTYSGLLNALDGITSNSGSITIMTTNHFDRLDQALIRGGRVDKRVYFGPPSSAQVTELFKRFYPEASDECAKRFCEKVFARAERKEARSMATLQQLFVRNREKTAAECVCIVDEFYEIYFTEKQQVKEMQENSMS
ncbi:Mitochondrial chaperone BCS1 [Gracilaria domingensis]|nr:Mitochondrial chaperone BCS1 [Gracilaria domingensis]